jgi:hypothetical protein
MTNGRLTVTTNLPTSPCPRWCRPPPKAAARAESVRMPVVDTAAADALKAAHDANAFMLGELRAMRAMMKERFETMAFVEKLGRTPVQAALAQKTPRRRFLGRADPQDARRHAR